MDTECAFITAICKEPHHDVPRLVFADWLDDQGDPWGEFIRIQCELARLEDPIEPVFDDSEASPTYPKVRAVDLVRIDGEAKPARPYNP